MKNLVLSFAVLFLLAGVGTKLMAQPVHAHATAEAKLLIPISIGATQAVLDFGTIATGVGGGTVIIAADLAGTRTNTGANIVLASDNAGHSAKFHVDGEPNQTYSITMTPDINTDLQLDKGLDNMLARLVCSPAAGSSTLDASGDEDIYVGGTLTVDAAQASGTYATAADAITITVNYN
jgi:Mat/Ecp fimbriae major subunit